MGAFFAPDPVSGFQINIKFKFEPCTKGQVKLNGREMKHNEGKLGWKMFDQVLIHLMHC